MTNKENKKNRGFMEEANYKNRVILFHDYLKRHLSSEYLYLSDKKDALESELIEMKFELEQKDVKLFKSAPQQDTRQYFSPLNLVDIDENQKDERMKQLASDIKRVEAEIKQYDIRLDEIKDILHEIEELQKYLEEME